MKYLKWAAAMGVSAAGLWFALRGVHWSDVADSISRVRRPAWLLVYAAVVGLIFFGRSLRWKIILSSLAPRARVRDFLPIMAGGFFLNNILPFRAGEVARVVWTRKKVGVPVGSLVSVLALERFFDMLTLLAFLLLVLSKKSDLLPSMSILWGLAGLSAAALAGLFVLTRYPRSITAAGWFQKLPLGLRKFSNHLIDGVSALKSKSALVLIFAVSCAFWAADVGFIQLVGRLFSLPLSWIDAAWIMCGLCLAAALPSAPGYVGTLEASGVAAAGLLGYPPEAALPFILVLHLTQMAGTALWGIPSILVIGSPRGDKSSGPPAAGARPARDDNETTLVR